MALAMTNSKAITTIISYQVEDDPVSDCAVNMCLIDVATYGVDEWITWSGLSVMEIFRSTADAVLEDIMNEVESKSAGEDIIDELLNTAQAERIDYKRALVSMRSGAIMYFEALILYTEIHNEVTGKYYLDG